MKLSTKYNILDGICAFACNAVAVLVCIRGGMILSLLPTFTAGMFWGRFMSRRDIERMMKA